MPVPVAGEAGPVVELRFALAVGDEEDVEEVVVAEGSEILKLLVENLAYGAGSPLEISKAAMKKTSSLARLKLGIKVTVQLDCVSERVSKRVWTEELEILVPSNNSNRILVKSVIHCNSIVSPSACTGLAMKFPATDPAGGGVTK